jgi:hypothetical protein
VGVILRRARQPHTHVVQGLLFDVGQNVVYPTAGLAPVVPTIGVAHPEASPAAGRIMSIGLLMVQTSEGELLEAILALYSPRGFPRRLHGWQQQRNQDADNRNHHQEFHESKTSMFPTTSFTVALSHDSLPLFNVT